MSVKIYRIKGLMKLRTGETQKFSIELTALREEHALETLYSLLGSRHKLKRKHIKVESIEEVKPEEVKSDYIRDLLAVDMIIK